MRLLAGSAFVLVALARMVVIVRRVPAPLDLLVWAESPFMTHLMKMRAGSPIFTDPADANSFVYAPGLEYLCRGLLAPLGLDLDVRFCRLVSVALGLAAAGVAASASSDVQAMVFGGERSRASRGLAFAAMGALLFASFTATSTHPDNLYTLHAVLVLFLAHRARGRQSLGYAFAAAAVAGCGIWAKQTAALSVLGACVALLGVRGWSRRQRLALGATALAVAALATAALIGPRFSRFWMLEVLSGQPMLAFKFWWLLRDVFTTPHRVMLLLAGIIVAARLILLRQKAANDWLLVWAAVGAFEVAPALLGYLRTFGAYNNLFIIDVWLLLLVWPALNARSPTQSENRGRQRLAAAVGAALAASLFPVEILPETWAQKLTPVLRATQPMTSDAFERYAERYTELVKSDLAAGKRVLVAHGTTVLIRAGVKEAPIDRMNSVLELLGSGLTHRARTLDRIRARRYDRIYVPDWPMFNAGWYGPEVEQALGANYRRVGLIPPANEFVGDPSTERIALMARVSILEPKD